MKSLLSISLIFTYVTALHTVVSPSELPIGRVNLLGNHPLEKRMTAILEETLVVLAGAFKTSSEAALMFDQEALSELKMTLAFVPGFETCTNSDEFKTLMATKAREMTKPQFMALTEPVIDSHQKAWISQLGYAVGGSRKLYSDYLTNVLIDYLQDKQAISLSGGEVQMRAIMNDVRSKQISQHEAQKVFIRYRHLRTNRKGANTLQEFSDKLAVKLLETQGPLATFYETWARAIKAFDSPSMYEGATSLGWSSGFR